MHGSYDLQWLKRLLAVRRYSPRHPENGNGTTS